MTSSQTCPATAPNPDETEALYPSGSTPGVRAATLSALCSYGVTPLVMQGALRQVLIQYFADPQNLLSSALRTRFIRDGAWGAGADTGIVIESLHKWRPELTESRPALILKEGAWQWQRMGIGDHVATDWRTGRADYSGRWQGSHTIFAIANGGAEAQEIAIEAMKCFLWFSAEIAHQLDLYRFIPVSIGEVAALKEATENYVVPITVAYAVPESWSLQPEAPRLKRIVWSASEVLPTY